MSRDSNGNYTLPPGNPVVPLTIIDANWANPTLDDVAAALSDSLSRSGLGGMQAPFKNADGTVGVPGISWINEPTSGFYRISPGVFGYAVGGVQVFTIDSTGISLLPNNSVKVKDGATGKQAVNFDQLAEAIADIEIAGGVKTELQIATEGQTIFTLVNEYRPLTASLAVFQNGQKLIAVRDYVENTSTQITLVSGTSANDAMEFLTNFPIGDAIGSEEVTYEPSGAGAVPTTVQTKLRESVSVKDFGAVGDGVTDDTAAFNAAWLASSPVAVLAPAASYVITGTVTGKFYSYGVVTILSGTVNTITNLVA